MDLLEEFNQILPEHVKQSKSRINVLILPPYGVDDYFNNKYWVHLTDQPDFITEQVKRLHPDIHSECNNVLVHHKEINMVNIMHQW